MLYSEKLNRVLKTASTRNKFSKLIAQSSVLEPPRRGITCKKHADAIRRLRRNVNSLQTELACSYAPGFIFIYFIELDMHT